jgi:hypothetical protein
MIQVERPPAYDEWAMVQRLSALYTTARQAKGNMTNEWTRNFRLTMNRTATTLPAAAGVRANEVFPTVDSRIGWMTDQEISCSITPAADPFSMWFGVQDMLCEQLECIINSVYVTDQWQAEIVKMLWNASMYGAGFLKVVWDQSLAEGKGNVAIKSTSPWCLYVDPYCTNLEDAEYIVEVHTMTAPQIERRFPEVGRRRIEFALQMGDVTKDHEPPDQQQNVGKQGVLTPVGSGPVVPPTTWGPPGGAIQPNTAQPYQAVNVYECWFKENYMEEVTPGDPTKDKETIVVTEWRVVVYAGGEILLDELASNLFHTNRHPYVRYVDVETGEFWGSALIRDIGPCQIAMNRLLALLQNNLEYTGNPIFVGVKGSGMERSTFVNRPGRIYDVEGGPGAKDKQPMWLAPPQMPQVLQFFIGWWRDEIERIAGIQGGQRGEIPSGRATDKQVAATQEAGFIRVRSSQRNMEMTLRKGFELAANLIIINYDVPRTVAIVGPEGEMNSVKLAANHFFSSSSPNGPAPLRFSMLVNAGSSKPTSRAARIAEAQWLKEANVVDDQFVLQAYRVSHWQAVLQRKQAADQQKAVLAALSGEKGEAKGPGTGHPH